MNTYIWINILIGLVFGLIIYSLTKSLHSYKKSEKLNTKELNDQLRFHFEVINKEIVKINDLIDQLSMKTIDIEET